ncbi:hypothetical protein MPTK1_6g08400 [Marchantia polymorpha subsp. ruderalis]|uniref:Uncharacterized protein n=2 Tax=Marchantia polymorpha TaxID=3197 RepID=A0AAF6BPW2_MARPO|nr:hypothetical protein MARPO_0060s0081 [Marchantia polymorpha]BBN14046.1 hypothetical protein Mp_6g08400 [Marchantia polymorpha subsp. ruderalis]|eukprot:PTQ36999.1 hypothetical protein MARPO_0060s0081 [Marchantia polymorpha]
MRLQSYAVTIRRNLPSCVFVPRAIIDLVGRVLLEIAGPHALSLRASRPLGYSSGEWGLRRRRTYHGTSERRVERFLGWEAQGRSTIVPNGPDTCRQDRPQTATSKYIRGGSHLFHSRYAILHCRKLDNSLR